MIDFSTREGIMKEWDQWRKYIAEGGKASWPRDAFEILLDYFDEQLTAQNDGHQKKIDEE